MLTSIAIAATILASTMPAPEPTVTLGQPPQFETALGADDVVFSPDGLRLAAIVSDGKKRTVALYNLADGTLTRRFGKLPAKGVARIGWAPEADRLVTAVQGVVHLWNPTKGTKLKHVDLGAEFRVELDRLVVSNRAEFVIYVPRRGESSATVDMFARKVGVEAIPYRKEVQGFDAMGRLLVNDHEAARLIDPVTSRPLQTCKAAKSTGRADAATGTQTWLRGEVWTRQLPNLARCKPSKWQPLRPGNQWRQAVIGLRGGVIAAANRQSVTVWDRNGTVLYSYQHHKPVLQYTHRLHVSPDGTHVAFPGRRLRILRMTDKRWLSLPNDVDDPSYVAISGNGRVIAVSDKMLGTRVFNRSDGAMLAALKPSKKVALGVTGSEVLTLTETHIQMTDTATGQILWDYPAKATHLATSGDRTTVAISSRWDKRVRLTVFEWTRHSPKMRHHTLSSDTGWTSSLALNRNGSQVLATLGSTHNLYVLDVGGTRLEVAHQHNFKSRGGLSRGVFVPGDLRLLTTPAFQKRADLTQTGTGHSRALRSGRHYTSAVVALPDGKRAVLADEGGTIGMWDLTTRRRLTTWRAHATNVQSIAASSDGRWLVSSSKDGRVKIWPIGTQISAAATAMVTR